MDFDLSDKDIGLRARSRRTSRIVNSTEGPVLRPRIFKPILSSTSSNSDEDEIPLPKRTKSADCDQKVTTFVADGKQGLKSSVYKSAVVKTCDADKPIRQTGRNYNLCIFISYNNITPPIYHLSTKSGSSASLVCETYERTDQPGIYKYRNFNGISEATKQTRLILIAKRSFTTSSAKYPMLALQAAGADYYRMSRFIQSHFEADPTKYIGINTESAMYKDGNFVNMWDDEDIRKTLEDDIGTQLLDLSMTSCPSIKKKPVI